MIEILSWTSRKDIVENFIFLGWINHLGGVEGRCFCKICTNLI